jgi:hypothetical protein
VLVECQGTNDARVEVEQAAGLGGGEGDDVAPGFIRYEG